MPKSERPVSAVKKREKQHQLQMDAAKAQQDAKRQEEDALRTGLTKEQLHELMENLRNLLSETEKAGRFKLRSFILSFVMFWYWTFIARDVMYVLTMIIYMHLYI